jgi:DNA-binding HxlR family transcriptional regulator
MPHGFGQFCPLALASEVLTQKWMLLVIRELAAGSTRFSDIRRGVPRISATLLKARLESLEHAGVVERTPAGLGQPAGYALTAAGLELKPVLAAIGEWGQRWARDIGPEDLDPRWLVWTLHRRLDTAAMPAARTVIEIAFTDAPSRDRRFWLVHQDGNIEICVKPPGFEVDLALRTSVRTLAEVWRGLRPVREEINAGRISLQGDPRLRRALPTWLLLSVYAPVPRPA